MLLATRTFDSPAMPSAMVGRSPGMTQNNRLERDERCYTSLSVPVIRRAPRRIGQVRPEPLHRHDEAAAEVDQEIDVGDAPQPPGEPARDLEPAEIGDRRAAPDGGERSGVAIAERSGRLAAGEARGDHAARHRRPSAWRRARCRAPAGPCRPSPRRCRRRRRCRDGRARTGPWRPPRARRGPCPRPATWRRARPARRRPRRWCAPPSARRHSVMPSSSQCSTARPRCTSTPSFSSALRACSARSAGKAGSRRGPASTRMMRAWVGSMTRNSSASAQCASSAIAPAISTPVGAAADHHEGQQRLALAPRRRSVSARSNASRMRRRMSVASSIFFRPGAHFSQSSCPK